jgi:hypothetical protein
MSFFLKQNDTSPAIRAMLVDGDGAVVDLTGCTARFHMKSIGDLTAKVDALASIVDPAKGIVQYNWSALDTDASGQFEGEFEITFPDLSIETFPNRSNIQITITAEIA